jgi:acetyltransferase-like isoleucine patch superfamily enzyme
MLLKRAVSAGQRFCRENLAARLGLGGVPERLSCDWRSRVRWGRNARGRWGTDLALRSVRLTVEDGAELTIGDHVSMEDADVRIGAGASVTIGSRTRLAHTSFEITGASRVELEEGVHVVGQGPRAALYVESSTAHLGRCVNIQGIVSVRFGGHLQVGEYSATGPNSLVRCEERVLVGSYCLVAYDASIFDTNAHATDWRARRERIRAGYPVGTSEVVRPQTAPIHIGDDVWIGTRAFVLKGTQLGDRVIVGMGTTVSGSVPADSVVVSQPPRVLSRTGKESSESEAE